MQKIIVTWRYGSLPLEGNLHTVDPANCYLPFALSMQTANLHWCGQQQDGHWSWCFRQACLQDYQGHLVNSNCCSTLSTPCSTARPQEAAHLWPIQFLSAWYCSGSKVRGFGRRRNRGNRFMWCELDDARLGIFFRSYSHSHFNIAMLGDLSEGSNIHLNLWCGDSALVWTSEQKIF